MAGERLYRDRREFIQLALLHRWHAVLVLVLLASGFILYSETLRPYTAWIRVPVKYLHIGAGLALVVLIGATVTRWAPFGGRPGLHWGRRTNVALAAALGLGWSLTGLAMLFKAYLPGEWRLYTVSSHDALSWLAVPWIATHVCFRWQKVRLELPEWWGGRPLRRAAGAPGRREVLWAGALACLGWAAYWLDREFGLRRGLAGRTGALATPGPRAAAGAPATPGAAPAPPGAEGSLSPDIEAMFRYDEAVGRPAGATAPETLAGGGMKGRFRLYFVTAGVPRFDPRTWRLEVGGLVERRLSLGWEELLARKSYTYVTNFHCVTGWSVFNCTWQGVPLADVLQAAGPRDWATLVKLYSADGAYTDHLTLEQACQPSVFLAYRLEGAPLPGLQGGPLRLVVPDMYGYKSVKWVQTIELIDFAEDGFWEVRGYPRDAYLEHREVACPRPDCGRVS